MRTIKLWKWRERDLDNRLVLLFYYHCAIFLLALFYGFSTNNSVIITLGYIHLCILLGIVFIKIPYREEYTIQKKKSKNEK